MNGYIVVVNAREHNLKNVTVSLPKGKLVVITGPSGAGKSSLAFDTIFVESQRRYIESLSPYARQFLHVYDKPDVDIIHGLAPSIAIDQKGLFKSPRSTVATITEIYDHLRLLFTSIGIPYSEDGVPLLKYTKTQISDVVCTMEGRKVHILSPCTDNSLERITKAGFSRLRIDGVICDIEDVTDLEGDVQVVIDRLSIEGAVGRRVIDAVEAAIAFNDNMVVVGIIAEDGEYADIMTFPLKLEFGGDMALSNLEPKMFSFNSPIGACSSCSGTGLQESFDVKLIVGDKNNSLAEIIDSLGCEDHLDRFPKLVYSKISAILKRDDINLQAPWCGLANDVREVILHGDDKFCGLMPLVESAINFYPMLRKFKREKACSDCNGSRLNDIALRVKISGWNIGEVVSLSVLKMKEWLGSLKKNLNVVQWTVAERLVQELMRRLLFLENVGLGYLTLDRRTATLSGGEGQRIKLASQIGSGLTDIIYVLDEPSIGLHKADNAKLIHSLLALRDIGNTVILVEHDDDAIRAADYIVDMGPCAGAKGGEVMAEGTLADILQNPNSITGAYMRDPGLVPVPKSRRIGSGRHIKLSGVSLHNIKDVDISFPLGKLICVTGVSGSGKSTLVMDVLVDLISHGRGDCLRKAEGLEFIDKVIEINQQPIGRTPRSNPATYTGMFDHIRQRMAATNESRMRGYGPGHFSFNTKGGRCDECNGDGGKKIEMHFLPDVYVVCERCNGKRYSKETLAVLYKGKNISDILDMTVSEALSFFENIIFIKEKLEALESVGLGYIRLGQPSNTLSGGESQRIKMARELSKRSTGSTLYILDEPTTGLHTCDIQNLLSVINGLVDRGNTVIVIEHNMDMIKCADYIIDMGPLGGDAGGRIVVQGLPEAIANCKESLTGKFLMQYLRN